MRLPSFFARYASGLVTGIGLIAMALLLWRTAWMSDDGFITLRTVDNMVNGYGPRWNVVERVQSFTHPLWMLLIVPFYAIAREPFYTVIAIQSALTLAMIFVCARTLAPTPLAAATFIGAFASSRALVDFSTSGLENALMHLLLALFVVVWRMDRASRPLTMAGLVTSGLLLCRLDIGALLAPVLLWMLWPLQRDRLRSFARGLVPFIAWEIFSLIYYGMLVPNTALAKLPIGVPKSELVAQGLKYLPATFHHDPLSVFLLVTTALLLITIGGVRGRLACAGMTLHLALMVSMGGDFMAGRFLTPALMLGLATLLAFASGRGPAPVRALVAGTAVVAALVHPQGVLRSPADFGGQATLTESFQVNGVADERRYYYPFLGLRPVFAGKARHPWAYHGLVMRTQQIPVAIRSNVGLVGYYAGPKTYVIDICGLTEPFLARLPVSHGTWRIGHFERDIPEGYVVSRERGENLLVDPKMRQLFDDLQEMTQGHVGDARRIGPILRRMLR
jgi:arabinofuranosyltransferase